MTEKQKEWYGILIKEIEEAHKKGVRDRSTRYDMVKVICGWFGQCDQIALEVIDQLCADNWIDE